MQSLITNRALRLTTARRLAIAVLTFSVAACTSIGPGTVPHDRVDYASAIGNSWKEQTLLNIVKLRYGDMPIFLEVAQVIAGYQLQSALSGSFTLGNFTLEPDRPLDGDRWSDGSKHLHRSTYGGLSTAHRGGFLEEIDDADPAKLRAVHGPSGLFRGARHADHAEFD